MYRRTSRTLFLVLISFLLCTNPFENNDKLLLLAIRCISAIKCYSFSAWTKKTNFILFSSFIYKCQSETDDRESDIAEIAGYLICIWSKEFLHIYLFSIRCCAVDDCSRSLLCQVSTIDMQNNSNNIDIEPKYFVVFVFFCSKIMTFNKIKIN